MVSGGTQGCVILPSFPPSIRHVYFFTFCLSFSSMSDMSAAFESQSQVLEGQQYIELQMHKKSPSSCMQLQCRHSHAIEIHSRPLIQLTSGPCHPLHPPSLTPHSPLPPLPLLPSLPDDAPTPTLPFKNSTTSPRCTSNISITPLSQPLLTKLPNLFEGFLSWAQMA